MYLDMEEKGLQPVRLRYVLSDCVNLEKMSSLIKLKYADMVNLNTPFRKTF